MGYRWGKIGRREDGEGGGPRGGDPVAIKTRQENHVGENLAGKVYRAPTVEAERGDLPYGVLCRMLSARRKSIQIASKL